MSISHAAFSVALILIFSPSPSCQTFAEKTSRAVKSFLSQRFLAYSKRDKLGGGHGSVRERGMESS